MAAIETVHLPNWWIVLVVVVAVLAFAGLALGTVAGRRRLLEPTGRALRSLARVMQHPRRAAELFGGSFAITGFYIAALVCALHAFGAGLGWAQIALVYLGASVVAAPAPTPGGLGAIEAALVAGLTTLGAPAAPEHRRCAHVPARHVLAAHRARLDRVPDAAQARHDLMFRPRLALQRASLSTC